MSACQTVFNFDYTYRRQHSKFLCNTFCKCACIFQSRVEKVIKIPSFVVLYLEESSGNLLDLYLTEGFSFQIVYAKICICKVLSVYFKKYAWQILCNNIYKQ